MSSSRTRTVVGRFADSAVALVLVVLSLLAIAEIAPSAFGYERYVITGGSMAGTYDLGSVVFEKTVPVEDLRVGDVITYQPPASSGVTTLVTHRIIKIGEKDGVPVFRTQGDANPDPDPWRFSLTQPEQPVVHFSAPYAGWVLIGLADRQTRILAIGVPAGAITVLSFVQLVGALRSRRRSRRDAAAESTSPSPAAASAPERELVGTHRR